MKRNANRQVLNISFAGVSMALALLLPFLTANSRELGNILCLMHIPILICGILCGPVYGAAVGCAAPLLRTLLFGMPPFPTVALPMAAELMVYGLMTGVLYRMFPKKIGFLYPNLILSMILGRLVSVLVKYGMYALGKTQFSLVTVLKMNFVTTLPGVAIQLVLIPSLIYILIKRGDMQNEDGRV